MSVFGAYSQYYDLMYADKDYPGETAFIDSLIKKHHPSARSVMNIGCGTGAHDFLLAERGYDCTGVDMSEEMLAAARSKAAARPGNAVAFHQGDARTVRLDRTFDVVVSLFHVLSYQTTNDDVLRMLSTARAHLKPGSTFIVDFWYGPAVLTERPAVRVKRLANGVINVVRIAEPVTHVNENVVDVNYSISIEERSSGRFTMLKESHRMRYFFLPELEQYLKATGFSLTASGSWMSGAQPGTDSWGVYIIATAV